MFVLRRTANAVFAADMYVFPGGRVDDVDHAAELEPYCDGLDDATASARLGIDNGGLAFWVAAVRECFEEAGVLLARRRDGGPLVIDEADRVAVHDGDAVDGAAVPSATTSCSTCRRSATSPTG